MWARDKCSAPPLEMDSRYTSAAGIGDLNQLSAAIPATRVEVSVSCRNLLDRDTFSKSDPICVLYIQAVGNKEWREYSQAALHLRLLESPRRRQLQAFIHQGLFAGVLNQLARYSFDICMGTFMALFQVLYSVYL